MKIVLALFLIGTTPFAPMWFLPVHLVAVLLWSAAAILGSPELVAGRLIKKAQCGQLKQVPDSPLKHADGSLYMDRWFLLEPSVWTFGIQVRLQCLYSSDADRELHDHPSWNISWILRNSYEELIPSLGWEGDPLFMGGRDEMVAKVWRDPGDVVFRRARYRHRLVIPQGQAVWTIFVFGPWQRHWGFTTETGWVWWKHWLGLEDKSVAPYKDRS